MSAAVTTAALRRDRKATIAWWLSVAALVAITVAFYPTVADNEELDRIWEDIPESLQALFGGTDLTSPVGYLECNRGQVRFVATGSLAGAAVLAR